MEDHDLINTSSLEPSIMFFSDPLVLWFKQNQSPDWHGPSLITVESIDDENTNDVKDDKQCSETVECLFIGDIPVDVYFDNGMLRLVCRKTWIIYYQMALFISANFTVSKYLSGESRTSNLRIRICHLSQSLNFRECYFLHSFRDFIYLGMIS
ncbi:hypothetical protein KUTeg_001545 [Tegillarca granosa]|uniref:Uncharacterized protein n=1 Tax=Tegillarca granosa TaxID=220873 RepID=A0ABQ9FRR8_TEGGR|nr:hypothetical protein KUTeg_001545 [Tegillarca granosa]